MRDIWVYGSLRFGEYNHYILNGCDYLGIGVIRGFKMYSFGLYPFVVETGIETDIIVVEGYMADLDTIQIIDEMEKASGYRLVDVEIEVNRGGVTNGEIYSMPLVYNNYGQVIGGDWVKSRDERYLSNYE